VRVLDGAIEQLPIAIASGHGVADDASLTTRSVVVRADSAGCTTGFLTACRARSVGFFVSARSNTQVMNAVFDAVGVRRLVGGHHPRRPTARRRRGGRADLAD
jgi:hypothetical protein